MNLNAEKFIFSFFSEPHFSSIFHFFDSIPMLLTVFRHDYMKNVSLQLAVHKTLLSDILLVFLACGELPFMSTIYYLYAQLYCDTLLGQPFFCTAVAKTAHAHVHKCTHKPPTKKMLTSHSLLPTSSVTTTQARFRDTNIFTHLFPIFQSVILVSLLTSSSHIKVPSDQGHLILPTSSFHDTKSDTTCTGCCQVARFSI